MTTPSGDDDPVRRTKPQAALIVKFEGGDIRPNRVPLPTLSLTLNAISKLAGAADTPAAVGEAKADPGPYQLIEVREGSAVYEFAGGFSNEQTYERLKIFGDVLNRPETASGVDFSLRAVADLSAVAKRLKCRISILAPVNGRPAVLARIGPDTSRSLRESLLVDGETSIFGQIKRVGGVTRMRCSFRLPAQPKLLHCKIRNADLSRRLGRYLYQNVVLHGQATWSRSNWRIVAFQVSGVQQLEPQPLTAAIEGLRQAGGSDWDAIDDPWEVLGIERGEE